MGQGETKSTSSKARGGVSLTSITFALLLCIPCSSIVAQGREEDRNVAVVILGDSLTAGYGIDKERAYPALLEEQARQEKLPVQVINAGLSGDTSAGGLRRLSWAVKVSPDLFILALGANDGLRGLQPSQTRENLSKIIKAVKEKHAAARVFIGAMEMPPNMGEEYRNAFRAVFEEVAATEGVKTLPFLLQDVAGNSDLMLPDAMHPNERGHEEIAKRLWPLLKPAIEEALRAGQVKSTARLPQR